MATVVRPVLTTAYAGRGPAPPAPGSTPGVTTAPGASVFRRAIHWLDEMSSPKPSTLGDFDGPAWFQASFQAAVEGMYMNGLAGSAACTAASLAGLYSGDKSHSQTVACLAGAGVAAAVLGAFAGGGSMASLTSAAVTHAAITGALLGAFVTFRGNQSSRVRDSAGNASMLAGPFLHGPGKVAAGLGAATAQRIGGPPLGQAAIAGVMAGAIGASLGYVGFTQLGPIGSGLVCGVAGGLGPSFGPRFSQFFRNASLELGDVIVSGAEKVGLMKTPPSRPVINAMGAVPSSFVKEGVRGCILADLSLKAFILGGIAESIQQMDIFLHERNADGKSTAAPGGSTPSTSASPLADRRPAAT